MTEKKNYVDNARLLDEIKKSQQQGSPTVALCLMVRQIVEGVLAHRNFRGYPDGLKEEMASQSFYQILKGLVRTYDTSKEKAFGYVSHACFLNFISQIMRYYKKNERERPILNEEVRDFRETGNYMNGKPMPSMRRAE